MRIEDVLKGWELNAGASESSVRDAASSLGHGLPSDYVSFLHDHNGGEGVIGVNYLILWKAEELSAFNHEYEVERYAPGLLLFGSDGGGEGYGFDTCDEAMPVVRVPFIGMERRYAAFVAPDFTGLLAELSK
jgi:hypothetical protein